MKKSKIFLTSAVCMLCALPSYADIANGASSATCDNSTIGATSGSTGLEAQWSANQYSENPGYYLLFDSGTLSTNQTCPAGSYCPGFTNQTFNDASIGLNSCASNDSNFPNSAAGASAATDCYRACNISNMGTGVGKTIAPIAHATAISGNDYYGAGVDTCVPTACDTGYHVDSGAGPLADYVSQDADYSEGNTTAGWEVEWDDNTQVYGASYCSAKSGDNHSWAWGGNSSDWTSTYSELTSASGEAKYCWCKMTSYSIAGGATQSINSSSWVFFLDYDSASSCTEDCGYDCGVNVQGDYGWRSAVFGDLGSSSGGTPSCVANTINIDWDPKNGGAHTQNQCTYGGAVTIPEQPTKAGYTFGGWKVKTSNN